jgi:transcriptional regulator with XRE-family HTH domain
VVELLVAAPRRNGVLLSNVVAYMLHRMNAATIVQEARRTAGLSRAELARRAGVPRSTVTRTEDGLVDPTFGMLQRILGAAQADLDATSRPLPARSLARLVEARSDTPWGEAIDWTALRAALDELTMHPDEVESAIATPPARSGNARLDALLAGIAEKLADDAGLPRPSWCRAVPALAEPWQAPGTPRMVARAAASAPDQFRHRNILLSESELWRGAPEWVR